MMWKTRLAQNFRHKAGKPLNINHLEPHLVGACRQGTIFQSRFFHCSEQNHRHVAQAWLVANQMDQLNAIKSPGHVQIGNQQIGVTSGEPFNGATGIPHDRDDMAVAAQQPPDALGGPRIILR